MDTTSTGLKPEGQNTVESSTNLIQLRNQKFGVQNMSTDATDVPTLQKDRAALPSNLEISSQSLVEIREPSGEPRENASSSGRSEHEYQRIVETQPTPKRSTGWMLSLLNEFNEQPEEKAEPNLSDLEKIASVYEMQGCSDDEQLEEPVELPQEEEESRPSKIEMILNRAPPLQLRKQGFKARPAPTTQPRPKEQQLKRHEVLRNQRLFKTKLSEEKSAQYRTRLKEYCRPPSVQRSMSSLRHSASSKSSARRVAPQPKKTENAINTRYSKVLAADSSLGLSSSSERYQSEVSKVRIEALEGRQRAQPQMHSNILVEQASGTPSPSHAALVRSTTNGHSPASKLLDFLSPVPQVVPTEPENVSSVFQSEREKESWVSDEAQVTTIDTSEHPHLTIAPVPQTSLKRSIHVLEVKQPVNFAIDKYFRIGEFRCTLTSLNRLEKQSC